MSVSPYSGRPARAFWRGGVAGAGLFPENLYRPKFPVTSETSVFTAGSCFAQHVGAAMKRAGIQVVDTEPALRGLPPETAKQFGYGLYSARFGNIYTVRQFRQLAEELVGRRNPSCPVWEKNGRYWDALRPGVEPDGLASPEHVAEMRARHLLAVGDAIEQAEVVVFTLGLTEAWEHRDSGTVYPTAPGTIAGTFDPEAFVFRNYDVDQILEDFRQLESTLAEIKPGLRWLLTVSPVPLAATASDDHVLTATTRSKATLRVVCDMLSRDCGHIDYFPSYEIVTSPGMAGRAFADDLRSVRPEVVDGIMAVFLASHGLAEPPASSQLDTLDVLDEAVCEDVLLDAFRP